MVDVIIFFYKWILFGTPCLAFFYMMALLFTNKWKQLVVAFLCLIIGGTLGSTIYESSYIGYPKSDPLIPIAHSLGCAASAALVGGGIFSLLEDKKFFSYAVGFGVVLPLTIGLDILNTA